ncbi:hypothetical protein DY000_02028375 [Brassica cretica]|uniref:Uncharacterized protein n=1 Tax=Brassica cretica TaxID=69181 RepID=A0ABQ7DVY9_BRACR|nr:hypothetical protein DY000_02028375 [Brassica cretica]
MDLLQFAFQTLDVNQKVKHVIRGNMWKLSRVERSVNPGIFLAMEILVNHFGEKFLLEKLRRAQAISRTARWKYSFFQRREEREVTFSLWFLYPRRRLNHSFFNFILFKEVGGSLGCRPPPPVSRILLQPYTAAIQKRRPLLLVSGILDFCLCKPNQKSGEYLSSLEPNRGRDSFVNPGGLASLPL